jgi:hypothetical protein
LTIPRSRRLQAGDAVLGIGNEGYPQRWKPASPADRAVSVTEFVGFCNRRLCSVSSDGSCPSTAVERPFGYAQGPEARSGTGSSLRDRKLAQGPETRSGTAPGRCEALASSSHASPVMESIRRSGCVTRSFAGIRRVGGLQYFIVRVIAHIEGRVVVRCQQSVE